MSRDWQIVNCMRLYGYWLWRSNVHSMCILSRRWAQKSGHSRYSSKSTCIFFLSLAVLYQIARITKSELTIILKTWYYLIICLASMLRLFFLSTLAFSRYFVFFLLSLHCCSNIRSIAFMSSLSHTAFVELASELSYSKEATYKGRKNYLSLSRHVRAW